MSFLRWGPGSPREEEALLIKCVCHLALSSVPFSSLRLQPWQQGNSRQSAVGERILRHSSGYLAIVERLLSFKIQVQSLFLSNYELCDHVK